MDIVWIVFHGVPLCDTMWHRRQRILDQRRSMIDESIQNLRKKKRKTNFDLKKKEPYLFDFSAGINADNHSIVKINFGRHKVHVYEQNTVLTWYEQLGECNYRNYRCLKKTAHTI